MLTNFYLLNSTHRPIHVYKITTKPEITNERDMSKLIKQLHPHLKEVFDFYVYIGDSLEIRGKTIADRVIYSFNDIISKESFEGVIDSVLIRASVSKIKRGLMLSYDKNKQHYIAVFNKLFRTLIMFSDYQYIKNPFAYSNEGMFYLNNEEITVPDEIWKILKETVKQITFQEEQESREQHLKQLAYKRLNTNIRREGDYFDYLEYDSEHDDNDEDDDEQEDKYDFGVKNSHHILQDISKFSIRRKDTYLKRIRDNENVFRGWEYQLKFLEKGLGIFLRPVVVRKNKNNVHHYCAEIADILRYTPEYTKKIK